MTIAPGVLAVALDVVDSHIATGHLAPRTCRTKNLLAKDRRGEAQYKIP